jgi:IS5 family transposase
MVRSGTLLDATLVPSASTRGDVRARQSGHRRRKPTHGYKALVATDEGAGLVRGVKITTANVHDAASLDTMLPADPREVYGDSAFGGPRSAASIRTKGGLPAVPGAAPGEEPRQAHREAASALPRTGLKITQPPSPSLAPD